MDGIFETEGKSEWGMAKSECMKCICYVYFIFMDIKLWFNVFENKKIQTKEKIS